MRKEVEFQMEEIVPSWAANYSEKKFSVYQTCFLSTKKNSHELNIDEETLRANASSILGNFLVAKLFAGDATSHLPDEVIFGYFPKEQEIVFEEVEESGEKIVKANAYAVISKQYGKEFNDIFTDDNLRNTSVEMTVETPEDDEHHVLSFDIFGLTCLGKTVKGSCPDANMKMIRFSEEEAEGFFKTSENLTALERFVEERKQSMAEKEKYVSHPVNTSKEAVYDGEWDGNKAKQDLVKEKNFSTLAPKVCMRLEDGWENREITKCGYPVMMLHDGEWVYSSKGLASALSYAKKENETSVVTKVEKIRKKLGLDDNEGKEETAKMSKEIEFAAVDIGDMWGKVFDALHAKYPDGDWGSVYRIEGIYEENNKKFAIIRRKDEDTKYRLDFSLTEDGLELSDEIIKVELEIVETDEVRKFAEPENVEKYRKFADDDDDDDEIEGRKAWAKVIKKVQDHEGNDVYVDSIEDDHIIYTKDDVRYRVNAKIKTESDDKSIDAEIDWDSVKKDKIQKMSADEMEAEMARLKKDIEDRDNIIMEKDTELAELRAFKKGVEDKEKAMFVESVMEEIKGFVDEAKFKEFREEGLACEMTEIDGWKNKVKAFCFEAGIKNPKKNKRDTVFSFAMDVNASKKDEGDVWERLRKL